MPHPTTAISPNNVDFVEAGSAGPVVVLVHSSVSGARQWRRLMDDLKDRFRVHEGCRSAERTARHRVDGGSQGFLTQISNPKVVVFFGSIFVAMLPSEVPGWMIATLIVIVTMNEIVWYSLVSLFFGASPVRRFYLIAKRWIDRTTAAFLGLLGLRLLWQAGDAA